MALAPGLKRKPGLFGASAPTVPAYLTPGIGDGMTANATPLAPQKPKFFGEGGVGRAIAGNIGDFLLQYSGMQPIYQPAMQQRQALQQQEANRLREFANQKALIDYRALNREPTSFEQILDAAGIQGDERVNLLRRKAESDAAGVPVGIDVQNPDGSVTRQYVRPGTLGGQSSGPPPAAIDALRGNPSLRDQFNQKYGPGAAERYLGGASGNAGGNF